MKSFKKLLRSMAEDRSEDRADDHEYQADDHRGHADDHADAVKMHRSKADSSKDSAVAKKHKTAADHHEKAREHALDAAHHHNGASDAHREGASGANKATTTADHHSSLHHDASEKAHQHSSNLKESISSIHLEEGKMKRFHDMVEKGMTAEQIAKKLGMPVKGVAEFMKGMKEDLDEDMKPNSDIDSHPAVKDARKQHKDGVWDGNVDRNGNAIVHIKGKPHTVTNTNTAESVGIDAEAYINEGGLWANIHAKRKRIKNGSKEKMKEPGSKGAPTDQDFKDASESVEEGLEQDGPKTKLGKSFGFGGSKAVDKYRKTKAQQRSDMNKKNDPGAAKKHLALSVVDREKADKKAKSKGTSLNKQFRSKMGYESVDEAADPKVGKAVQGLNDLGNKMKGRDQKDIRRIEKLYRSGNSKVFQGAIRALDTDLRDQVKDIFDALGMVKQGVIESVDLAEAKKLGSRVKITKGRFAGKEGIIRQMDNGRFKGADKSFDIDLDNGKEANGVPGKDIKIVKESVDLDEGRVKDQMVKDSEKMSKKAFTKKYGKQNADDLYEEVSEATQAIKWRVKPPAGTKNIHPDSKWPGMKKGDVEKLNASYSESDEQVNHLTALYINENNISYDELENMTEEELNELIGKAIGGALKLGAKAVVGTARLAGAGAKVAGKIAKKTVVNKQGSIRGTKAAKQDNADAAQEKATKSAEKERSKRDARDAMAKRHAKAVSDLKKKQDKPKK
tara:strand:- start:400 stop:2598 length:2199 start_codon:yes stop_codon:yes gene_type:complete